MTFDELNLNKPLLEALDGLGFTAPTTIQKKAFSVIMSGRDVCGIAQTGTGKTFAYLLPCLRLWQPAKDRHPQILVMVPTRELVVQVVEAVKSLTSHIPHMVVAGVYGGVNINPQKLAMENGVDILVATPGRLLDLALSASLKLKSVKKLVIDEVDEMLALGFRKQLKDILDLLPEKRQNLLFSATITDEVEDLMDLYFNNPVRIEAAPTGTPLDSIRQSAYLVPNFYTKANLLESLLRNDASMTKVLVFVATKHLADQLYAHLEENYKDHMGVIHSNKEQNHRFNTVRQFEEGNYRFIIATDIIARGLDIAQITHVINFDLPEVPEHYIHRIGRTGRADKEGIAISFITEKDTEQHEAIETLMDYQIPMMDLPSDVEVVTELKEWEKEKPFMRELAAQLPKREAGAAAFHEKSAKNKKVNFTTSRKDKMMQKYGKPKTRGQKKKRR